MSYDVEVTDTFGGEANYCWVRRYIVDGKPSDLALVRRAKALAGWTGLRCQSSDMGDMTELRPVGRSAPCWIMFITWRDTSNPYRHNPEHEDATGEEEEKGTPEPMTPDTEVMRASDPVFPAMSVELARHGDAVLWIRGSL